MFKWTAQKKKRKTKNVNLIIVNQREQQKVPSKINEI